ncbi:hypothetical protein FRB99_007260 [Tulasnella sp. 403]|nr:hypothetical protein FRB99_007260 [Tulasnella sp. 403]
MTSKQALPENSAWPTIPAGGSTLVCDEPHLLRVGSGSKMKALVKWSIQFLLDNPRRPLTLHTLSPAESAFVASGMSRHNRDVVTSKNVSLTARLISIVEIIKREYPKALRAQTKQSDPIKVLDIVTLYQYNEVKCFEDVESQGGTAAVEPVSREEEIMSAFKGKKHLPVKRTPYMRITLCGRPLPMYEAKGATPQVSNSRLTKIQRVRAAKRAAKKQTMSTTQREDNEGDVDVMDEDRPEIEGKNNVGTVVL